MHFGSVGFFLPPCKAVPCFTVQARCPLVMVFDTHLEVTIPKEAAIEVEARVCHSHDLASAIQSGRPQREVLRIIRRTLWQRLGQGTGLHGGCRLRSGQVQDVTTNTRDACYAVLVESVSCAMC
eukprot:1148607-Pelagomonas_calceolata.AAC.6